AFAGSGATRAGFVNELLRNRPYLLREAEEGVTALWGSSKAQCLADLCRSVSDGSLKTGMAAEMRELKKRIRLLEQENEVLRRAAAYLSQANLPGKGSTRS
ncbi:MAG: hypothetical protein J0H22_05875, partial [Actinobacteria bacterium]|nr:hypothetical protein [Actinomycetota bacterium]